jgi:hypothetical protein
MEDLIPNGRDVGVYGARAAGDGATTDADTGLAGEASGRGRDSTAFMEMDMQHVELFE